MDLLINICLTILGYIPGIVRPFVASLTFQLHALYIILFVPLALFNANE